MRSSSQISNMTLRHFFCKIYYISEEQIRPQLILQQFDRPYFTNYMHMWIWLCFMGSRCLLYGETLTLILKRSVGAQIATACATIQLR